MLIPYPTDEVIHILIAGLSTATKCLAGTFNPDPRGKTVEACQACTAGYYCATPGLDSPTGM